MVEAAENKRMVGGGVWAWAAGSVFLLAAAYWKLFAYEAPVRLTNEIEGWFFLASDTSPIVVLALVGWVLIRRRERIQGALGGPPAILHAVAWLVPGIAFYGWATYIEAYDLLAVSLAANMLALGYWLGGKPLGRALWLPSAMTLLAIPLPAAFVNQIVFPLQLTTAHITTFLLESIGIPALLEGDQIHLLERDFEVIETCSGLRSLETLTLVALLYIDLFVRNSKRALIVLLSAPVIAFLVNSVRVLSLVLNPDSQELAIHTLQGVATLLAGVGALWGIDSLFMRFPATADREDGGVRDSGGTTPGSWAPIAVFAAGLALGSFLIPHWEAPGRDNFSIHSLFPRESRIWESRKLSVDRNFLGSVDFTKIFYREYGEAGKAVRVFIGYSDLAARHSSPISSKTAHPGSGWEIEDSAEGRSRIELPEIDATVERYVMRYGAERSLVYHWREGANSAFEEVMRGFLGLDVSPARRSDGVSVIRLETDIAPTVTGAAEADKRLSRFTSVVRKVVEKIIDPDPPKAPAT